MASLFLQGPRAEAEMILDPSQVSGVCPTCHPPCYHPLVLAPRYVYPQEMVVSWDFSPSSLESEDHTMCLHQAQDPIFSPRLYGVVPISDN